jgi:hypothetical protein
MNSQAKPIRLLRIVIKEVKKVEVDQRLLAFDVVSQNKSVLTEGFIVPDASQACALIVRRTPDVLFLKIDDLQKLEASLPSILSPEATTLLVSFLGREAPSRQASLQWLEEHLKEYRIITTRDCPYTISCSLHRGCSLEVAAALSAFQTCKAVLHLDEDVAIDSEMRMPMEMHLFERGTHKRHVLTPEHMFHVCAHKEWPTSLDSVGGSETKGEPKDEPNGKPTDKPTGKPENKVVIGTQPTA